MGQKGHKNIMESKIEANEELHCILLMAVLDGTAHYVVAACEDRSGCQAMTTLKNGSMAMNPNKTPLTASSRNWGV